MDVILCHQTADFDAVGAAVGLARLRPGGRIVLTGGAHPTVKEFLALHRDELPLIELRSVNPERIRSLCIVDNQWRDRLGKAAAWLDLPGLKAIELYDHHLQGKSDIEATRVYLEPVGATTTMIAEALQQAGIQPNSIEATVMALGIHVDTGSLTFGGSTPRDAYALAWLMSMGANVKTIARYCEPNFSLELQELFGEALEALEIETVQGYKIARVLLITEDFVPGLSGIAERLIDLTDADALLFGHTYRKGEGKDRSRLTAIGRSRIEGVNLSVLFAPYGGGGHPRAAAVSFRDVNPEQQLQALFRGLIEQIPHPPTARDIMSSPVRTIRPDTSIEQAERILFRYGHSGLSVVDEGDRLVGVISRRDLDLALHHGFRHAPVKGYMTREPKTITPDTSLPEIESRMVTYDLGRLPVLEHGQLVGIVTRTDVLRQIHQEQKTRTEPTYPLVSCLLPSIQERLEPVLWEFLRSAAISAEERGWHLYLVGGAVRDLLLAEKAETLRLQDIDLVVDGFHRSADAGAGVILANDLQQRYPEARISIHGEFQTAALLWHRDARFGSLWVDIATARTEFYPYPAANPQVEASSIRQDLYRRDFTINALAVRLTSPRPGELLDFFGGVLDLKSRQIRVLHANSFIEDPTRIYRAVRFATRLGFAIEPITEGYIRYAIASGVYDRSRGENPTVPALATRLKAELNSLLEADYWKEAVQRLAALDAFKCLHPDLSLTPALWWQVRYLDRWVRFLPGSPLVTPWLMRLEILLAGVGDRERVAIAQNLQLPKESIDRLQQLETAAREIGERLPLLQKPSEIAGFLRVYRTGLLLLVAARGTRQIRSLLWRYLSQWSRVKAPLDGHDLRKMGYKPGPRFGDLLDALLAATLDGEIGTPEEAEGFLKQFTNPTTI
jgi:tRNA nucleotidyltransferase (CCA-adding enzyme)